MLTPQLLIELLGGFPTPTRIEYLVLDEQALDGYTRQLIEYDGWPGERIKAYLLLPQNKPARLPGILAIHQDGDKRPYSYGKSEVAGLGGVKELAYGLELCLQGYVVICPDRFPFESRSLANSPFQETFRQFPLSVQLGGQTIDLTEDLYRGAAANRLLVEGHTLLGKELYELCRAVDILESVSQVDARRLGVIGHSAGGLLVALTMFIEPRLKAGCASSGTILIRWIYGPENLRLMNGFGGLLAVPSLVKAGDLDDVLAGLAPRPWLETHGEFTQEQVDEKSAKAYTRYTELGVPERYQSLVYPARAHLFRQDMRQKSYAWLDRWLLRSIEPQTS